VERLGCTPEALRDLSVSLNNVGQVARVQGDWTQADSVYRESLALRRQLVERLGGTPEALDDLASVLANLAQVPGHDGPERAEAIAIFQQLVQRAPTIKTYADKLAVLQSESSAPANPSSK
jgi:tetratricopeptide (TPR) repeat protein